MTDTRDTMLGVMMRNALELSRLLLEDGDIEAAMHARNGASYALACHEILHGEVGEQDPELREKLLAAAFDAAEAIDRADPSLREPDDVRLH